jgi:site-specific DNA recombinase
VRTSTGADWSATAIRAVARNLHYCGIRVHHGTEHPAGWPAIVPEHLLRAARQRIAGNVRARTMPTSVPVHLLSGIAVCGECGARLFRGHDRGGVHIYTCRALGFVTADGRTLGLGHLTIRKEPVDEIVLEAVAAWLDRPDVAAIVAAATEHVDDPATHELAALRARLADATGAYNAGSLSIATLTLIEADLTPKIAAAEERTRRAVLSPAVASALGRDFRALPLGEQREVLTSLVTVTIRKGRPTRSFDPERVQIDWRL